MPQLRLNLLGSFHATIDGVSLTQFRSDKVRALLAYLALEAATPVSRIHLVNLLWHGYSVSAGRVSLRVSLFNLNKILGSLNVLVTTRRTVQLQRPEPLVWCDVIEFEKLVNAHQHQPTYESWQAVHNLYKEEFMRGFEFLDSTSFRDWRALRQERLREQIHYLRPPQ